LQYAPTQNGRLNANWQNANGESKDTSGNGVVTPGHRQHLAAVYADSKLTLFVDGREVSSHGAPPPTPIDGQLQFRWNGLVDDVRVSTTVPSTAAFTPQQRFQPDADTFALYHFDEGAGDVLQDASGNKRDGKTTAAKWVRADGSPITTPERAGYIAGTSGAGS